MVALPKSTMTVPEFYDWWNARPTDERFEPADGRVGFSSPGFSVPVDRVLGRESP